MTLDADNNANPMLPTLARWRGWPPTHRLVNRWRLGDRLRMGRVENRPRPGGLIFRLGGGTVHLIARRETLRPLTFAPRWRLRVHLHHPAAHRAEVRPAAGSRDERSWARSQPLTGSINDPRHRGSGERSGIPAVLRSRPLLAPVATLMARHPSDDLAQATGQQAGLIVGRILREYQRIEARQQTPVVIRERSNIAVEIERALTNARKREADSPIEPRTPGIDWPGGHGHLAPPATDLDRLTDQIVSRIDDRLIAHRERMGRVF